MYLARTAESVLRRYLTLFPCVVVTGPRQSGKSTLIRRMLPEVDYVTFDDPQEQQAFATDPRGFLARFPGKVILDEVQRVPDLFRYLKISIDSAPELVGRFVLTGSNQLLMQKNLSESLAGRAAYLTLLPLELNEMPAPDRPSQILRGSYPALVVRKFEGSREWYSAYLATYLERDLRLVFDIGKLKDFQTLVHLLAARVTQETHVATLAREIGVSAHTVDSWMSALEATFLTFSLRPFSANLGKRLIKRPKTYWWDCGLVASLTGLRDHEALEGGPLAGPLFENLVVAELVKRSLHLVDGKEFWFYRDNSGLEVDLIMVDHEARMVTLTEIKAGSTPKVEWAKRLDSVTRLLRPLFESQGHRMAQRIVYRGDTKRNWPTLGTDYVSWDEL